MLHWWKKAGVVLSKQELVMVHTMLRYGIRPSRGVHILGNSSECWWCVDSWSLSFILSFVLQESVVRNLDGGYMNCHVCCLGQRMDLSLHWCRAIFGYMCVYTQQMLYIIEIKALCLLEMTKSCHLPIKLANKLIRKKASIPEIQNVLKPRGSRRKG